MALGHKHVTVSAAGCGFNAHSRKYFIFSCLRSDAETRHGVQHALTSEFGQKGPNTRFPLPALLHAGNSVQLERKKSLDTLIM